MSEFITTTEKECKPLFNHDKKEPFRNNHMRRREWLQAIAAGDAIRVIKDRGFEDAFVKKVSGTQIFVFRYKKNNGEMFVAKYCRKRGVRTGPWMGKARDSLEPIPMTTDCNSCHQASSRDTAPTGEI